jgi:hypothetical protein
MNPPQESLPQIEDISPDIDQKLCETCIPSSLNITIAFYYIFLISSDKTQRKPSIRSILG